MRISDWSSDVCSSDLAFRKRDADGDLPVGQREFRAILVDLAKRRDADRLAESLGGDAKLRGEREARANDDLGTLKIALDARRADFLNLGHFGKQPVADIFERLRVVAAERDRDVPAASATAARLRDRKSTRLNSSH